MWFSFLWAGSGHNLWRASPWWSSLNIFVSFRYINSFYFSTHHFHFSVYLECKPMRCSCLLCHLNCFRRAGLTIFIYIRYRNFYWHNREFCQESSVACYLLWCNLCFPIWPPMWCLGPFSEKSRGLFATPIWLLAIWNSWKWRYFLIISLINSQSFTIDWDAFSNFPLFHKTSFEGCLGDSVSFHICSILFFNFNSFPLTSYNRCVCNALKLHAYLCTWHFVF